MGYIVKKYYCIILFLIIHTSLAQATILSSSIESIHPAVPKVGEKVVIRIAIIEDTSLRTLQHNYSYTSTDIVEFTHIQRRLIQKKQYIEVEIRIKKSGTIYIPAIYENNYKISLPLITVTSSISDNSVYTPLSVGIPIGMIAYGIVSIIIFLCVFILLVYLVLNMSSLFKKWMLIMYDYVSHMYSVYMTNKMLKILNGIGTPKMKKTCTTKELYRSLDIILRKRLQFLLGLSHANSMTYTEIKNLLYRLQIKEQYFVSQLHDFFFVMYEAEYGVHHYPLEIRKRHCQFLLLLIKEIKKVSLKIKYKTSPIAVIH